MKVVSWPRKMNVSILRLPLLSEKSLDFKQSLKRKNRKNGKERSKKRSHQRILQAEDTEKLLHVPFCRDHGHVDHGKTRTLMPFERLTCETESRGITKYRCLLPKNDVNSPYRYARSRSVYSDVHAGKIADIGILIVA